MEERDNLSDLYTHEGWKPLMKIIECLTQEQEQALVTLSVEEGAEKLFHLKLRAEGARKLAGLISKAREQHVQEERKERAVAQRPQKKA